MNVTFSGGRRGNQSLPVSLERLLVFTSQFLEHSRIDHVLNRLICRVYSAGRKAHSRELRGVRRRASGTGHTVSGELRRLAILIDCNLLKSLERIKVYVEHRWCYLRRHSYWNFISTKELDTSKGHSTSRERTSAQNLLLARSTKQSRANDESVTT